MNSEKSEHSTAVLDARAAAAIDLDDVPEVDELETALEELAPPPEADGMADTEAAAVARVLCGNAPDGVDVLVRRCGDGWLSVLLTGLPRPGQPSGAAHVFLDRWIIAVQNFYDCPGGNCAHVDGSDHRPEIDWETHWQRYQVMHRPGLPYW